MIAEGRKSVHEGEKIATVGRSGLTYGPHLYFGMIVDGRPGRSVVRIYTSRPAGASPQGASRSNPGPAAMFARNTDWNALTDQPTIAGTARVPASVTH